MTSMVIIFSFVVDHRTAAPARTEHQRSEKRHHARTRRKKICIRSVGLIERTGSQRHAAHDNARRKGSVEALSGCGERTRGGDGDEMQRSEEHTSELQSLMRISYAVFCLKKKTRKIKK